MKARIMPEQVIKNCPFCDQKPALIKDGHWWTIDCGDHERDNGVHCLIRVQATHMNMVECIRRWNSRATIDDKSMRRKLYESSNESGYILFEDAAKIVESCNTRVTPQPDQPTTNPHTLAMEEALIALGILGERFDIESERNAGIIYRKAIASLTKALGR